MPQAAPDSPSLVHAQAAHNTPQHTPAYSVVLAHHDLGYAAIHPRILDAVVHNHRKRLFSKKGHRGFPIRATTSEACLITRAV